MCSSCDVGDRLTACRAKHWLKWQVCAAALMLVGGAVTLVLRPTGAPPTQNRADRVFSADSRNQAADLPFLRRVAALQMPPNVRVAALRLIRHERFLQRATGGARRAQVGRGRVGQTSALARLRRHAEADALVARVELEAGQSNALKRAARISLQAAELALRAIGSSSAATRRPRRAMTSP
jgi:hypothetical protein